MHAGYQPSQHHFSLYPVNSAPVRPVTTQRCKGIQYSRMSRDLLGGTGLPKGHSLQFMGAPGALRTEAVPPSAREFRRGGFARVERCPHSRLVRVCYTSDCWFWRGGRASVGFGEGPTCSSGLHASTSLLSQSTLISLFLSGADCNARSHPHTDPHDTTSTLAHAPPR